MSAAIERPDHVELLVPDRAEAAEWYGRVLGLVPVAAAAAWAVNPQGPLMLSGDGTMGQVMLALFAGQPQGPYAERGFRRLAFRTSAQGLLAFARDSGALGVTPEGGSLSPIDHGESFSVYFRDPYGNQLELTTYDHDAVRAAQLR